MSGGATVGGGACARQFRSEVRKLTTLRMTPGFGALGVAYVLVDTVALLALAGVDDPPADPATPDGLRAVLASGSGAYLFAVVVGIMAATGEHRHGTAAATHLVQPSRPRVIGAKVAASALAGLVYGVAGALACLLVALPWVAAIDHAPLTAGDVVRAGLGTVVAVALFAALGAGLGALVRSQVVALVAGLVWLVLGEGLLVSLLPEVGRWLPSGGMAALTGSRDDVGPEWAGALVLVAYAVALAVAAALAEARRDLA